MPNRRKDKDCVDIRICVRNEVDRAIIKYQGNRIARHGKPYKKTEAASDLFEQLLGRAGLLDHDEP